MTDGAIRARYSLPGSMLIFDRTNLVTKDCQLQSAVGYQSLLSDDGCAQLVQSHEYLEQLFS